MSMKYYDAFCGIGGFHLGIVQAQPDWECIGACEIDKFARNVYSHHFPKVKIDEDITKLDRLPEGTEMFCGGFPCQSFSIAGKRRGFSDTRGTLFFEIARLCEVSRPKILFLENVGGLLNHGGGSTYRIILRTLTELGYCVEWQVLNSKYFVPQNRERIFIVGHLGKEPAKKVFPIEESGEGDTEPQDETQGEGQRLRGEIASCLAQRDYKGGNNLIISHAPRCGNPKKGGTGRLASTEKCFTLDTKPHYVSVQPILTPNRLEKRQNGRRIKDDGEPAFSLTAQDRHGIFLDRKNIRRLTPLECERLQGFPDGFTKIEGNSDCQRYKQLGNAVTVNVIKEVASRIEG